MAIPVLIIGKSGSGKSTSLRNFKNDEISIINVEGKPLPFRNNFKNIIHTDDYRTVCECLKESKPNSIVIDDSGYLITNAFMRGHGAGRGNAIFNLYNQLADDFWKLIEYAKRLPDDKIVYFMMHEDKNDVGDIKPKTIGKLLDDKVCVEGMFTIVLRAIKKDGQYLFLTTTDGMDVTKTPLGMFEQEAIDNDLKQVDSIIREYYGLAGKGEKNE